MLQEGTPAQFRALAHPFEEVQQQLANGLSLPIFASHWKNASLNHIADIEKSLRHIAGIIKQKGREILTQYTITPPQFVGLQWLYEYGDMTIGELSLLFSKHLSLFSFFSTQIARLQHEYTNCTSKQITGSLLVTRRNTGSI